GRRVAVERRADRGSEPVPERHVLGLFARVLSVTCGGGRPRQRHDRMPVLAGIERQLLLRQLAALPTLVERVLENIPASPGIVDTRAKLHLAPSARKRPRRLMLAGGSIRSRSRVKRHWRGARRAARAKRSTPMPALPASAHSGLRRHTKPIQVVMAARSGRTSIGEKAPTRFELVCEALQA